MQVQSIMTRDPAVVPPSMSVEAVAQLLAHRQISAAFVVDASGTPIGVVSESDLVRRLVPVVEQEAELGWLARHLLSADHAAKDYVRTYGRHARDIMSTDVAVVDEDTSVEDAAKLMHKRNVRRVGVLRDNRITGVVSRADLVKVITMSPDRIGTAGPDWHIQKTVAEEIRRHPWATERLTSVIVENGIVRLEGYCRSEQARQALCVAAERVEGVRGVEDKMEISPLHDYSLYPQI